MAWPLGLIAWIFITSAHWGFNPTDEGHVLSMADRILYGEVPHRDIIYPRPFGSALLHTIDFLVPLPLLEASRLVTLFEITLYSIFLASFLYRKSPLQWSCIEALGAAVSALLNIHVFPLMSWHTVDGVFLLSLGLLLVGRPGEKWWKVSRILGFVFIGSAGLVKQSFLPGILVGLILTLHFSRKLPERAKWRRLIEAAAISSAPTTLYVVVITVLGGFSEMWTQLTSATPVWGERLLSGLTNGQFRDAVLRLAVPAVMAFVVVIVGKRVRRSARISPRVNQTASILGVAAAASASIWILRNPIGYGMFFNLWGVNLFWMLVAIVATKALADREIDGRAVAVLAVGWMTSLAWGYAIPNLVGGTLALAAVVIIWREAAIAFSRPFLRPLVSAALLGASCWVGFAFLENRKGTPYFDRPSTQLTATLGGISPEFGRIRTNESTAAYLRELKDCVGQYPAKYVAVLPDNPVIYLLLNLRNPFPTDWPLPAEVKGSEGRILESAHQLGRDRDFLVLFQTMSAFDLATRSAPRADPRTPPFLYDRSPGSPFVRGSGLILANSILKALDGKPVTCGSFVGSYAGLT